MDCIYVVVLVLESCSTWFKIEQRIVVYDYKKFMNECAECFHKEKCKSLLFKANRLKDNYNSFNNCCNIALTTIRMNQCLIVLVFEYCSPWFEHYYKIFYKFYERLFVQGKV